MPISPSPVLWRGQGAETPRDSGKPVRQVYVASAAARPEGTGGSRRVRPLSAARRPSLGMRPRNRGRVPGPWPLAPTSARTTGNRSAPRDPAIQTGSAFEPADGPADIVRQKREANACWASLVSFCREDVSRTVPTGHRARTRGERVTTCRRFTSMHRRTAPPTRPAPLCVGPTDAT